MTFRGVSHLPRLVAYELRTTVAERQTLVKQSHTLTYIFAEVYSVFVLLSSMPMHHSGDGGRVA